MQFLEVEDNFKYAKQHHNGCWYLCDGKDANPIKIGERVRKINSQMGTNVLNGVVVGSFNYNVDGNVGYSVLWDINPNRVYFVLSSDLEKE